MGGDCQEVMQRCDAAVLDGLIRNALNKARETRSDLEKLGVDFFGTNGSEGEAKLKESTSPASWFKSTRETLRDLNDELDKQRDELNSIFSLTCMLNDENPKEAG